MIINDISVKDIINTVCQDIIYILVYLKIRQYLSNELWHSFK